MKMDVTKSFQVILTLFYGQFIASSIFDSFIRTIPDLIEDPTSYYLAIKGYSNFFIIYLILRLHIKDLSFIINLNSC